VGIEPIFMSKPMRRRLVEQRLRANRCKPLRNTGRHEVWGCPCGQHIAPVPNHREITAGVVRDIEQKMACLRKGWLK
jgi:hypothetical protein